MNASTSRAMGVTLSGTTSVEPPTPRLSTRMTSRSCARRSTGAGCELSRFPPEVLEHHQRGRGRVRIAVAAVDERHLSDLEREVLRRQLTVLDLGEMARLRQGFACTHGFLPSAGGEFEVDD